MKLFDTHAHIMDKRFNQDRDALIESFAEHDVMLVLECSAETSDWPKVKQITQYDCLYGAYGLHPHAASEASDGYLDQIAAYCQDEKARAVGEIGLDYHYDFSPRDQQKQVLREQIELAIALDKPVVLHEREAHADMLEILTDYTGKLRGVLHCYSGSVEMMPRFLSLGLHLGFGGTSTFHNAKKTRAVLEEVPLDRMLIETDSPYLTPVPFRGQRNDPTYVRYVCENIAQLRGESVEKIAEITWNNGCALFQVEQ